MYSQTALKIYAAKIEGIIKSNADFWRKFGCKEKIESLNLNTEEYGKRLNEKDVSLICFSDDGFPLLSEKLKLSEKPYFFAYRGDISLLKKRVDNVSVIGTLTPDGNIIERERKIVKRLVESGFNVVSGLAGGCDTAAHKECIKNNGKTVAFLPSTLERIYPVSNRRLADRIAESGGLIITEYVTEPLNRYERTGRFIGRDRLQAMFAKNIILIASSLPGQGDSGSRHAMAKALDYGTKRYVTYSESTDGGNVLFGLNRKLIEEGATVLTPNVLNGFKVNC